MMGADRDAEAGGVARDGGIANGGTKEGAFSDPGSSEPLVSAPPSCSFSSSLAP